MLVGRRVVTTAAVTLSAALQISAPAPRPPCHEVAAVGEEKPLAAAQPTHGVRHQYFAALRLRGNLRGQDHRRAEEVVVFFYRLRRR
jgi:hypothetical protein